MEVWYTLKNRSGHIQLAWSLQFEPVCFPSLISSKPRLFYCHPTTKRAHPPPQPRLLLQCSQLSIRKWCTGLNSGIRHKGGPAAGGFGVTGEFGRSSCELRFQRPTPAEVVGSAHTFHISQCSLGWDRQKEGEFFWRAMFLLHFETSL